MDFETVYNFGKNVDVLTIEIEHVNVEALEKLQSEGVKVYPQPEVIRIIQDNVCKNNFTEPMAFPQLILY
jgi:5-(carboxyamino)imidazole ribonucleotide synthase